MKPDLLTELPSQSVQLCWARSDRLALRTFSVPSVSKCLRYNFDLLLWCRVIVRRITVKRPAQPSCLSKRFAPNLKNTLKP
jgi:hypothetical protein